VLINISYQKKKTYRLLYRSSRRDHTHFLQKKINWLDELSNEDSIRDQITSAEYWENNYIGKEDQNGEEKTEATYTTPGQQRHRLHGRPHPHVLFPP
jgi:hypothetical protein